MLWSTLGNFATFWDLKFGYFGCDARISDTQVLGMRRVESWEVLPAENGYGYV